MADRKPRVVRSAEERIADLEKKIETYKKNISNCEKKIEAIRNPKKRSADTGRIRDIITQAKASMTAEEIAEKLGIKLEVTEEE